MAAIGGSVKEMESSVHSTPFSTLRKHQDLHPRSSNTPSLAHLPHYNPAHPDESRMNPPSCERIPSFWPPPPAAGENKTCLRGNLAQVLLTPTGVLCVVPLHKTAGSTPRADFRSEATIAFRAPESQKNPCLVGYLPRSLSRTCGAGG